MAEEQNEPPEILYHYCSVEAFKAITESRHLRMTNVYFMNDNQEYLWLIEKAKEMIQSIDSDAREQPGRATQIKEILSELSEFSAHPYSLSFSKEEDMMGQWIAYADEGSGFSIGFDSAILKSIVNDIDVRYESSVTKIDKVSYKERNQSRTVKKLISKYLKETKSKTDFMNLFYPYAARCKSTSFKLEEEWRIYHLPNKSPPEPLLSFFTRKNQIIPYIKFCYSPMEINGIPQKRICLGPKNYARDERGMESLKLFLRKIIGPNEIIIEKSKATLQ